MWGGEGGEGGEGSETRRRRKKWAWASGTDLRGGRTNGNKNIEPLTDVMAMMSSVKITSQFIHQWTLRRLPVPLPGTLCVRGRVRRRKIGRFTTQTPTNTFLLSAACLVQILLESRSAPAHFSLSREGLKPATPDGILP